MKLKQILISCVALYALLFATACPVKKVDIDTVRSNSKRLSTIGNEAVNVTRGLMQQGVITPDLTIRIGNGYKRVAKLGQTFDASVESVAAAYGTNIPKPEIEKLFQAFNDDIVGAFVELLEEVKVLNNGALWRESIALIKVAILAIAKIFKQEKKVAARIDAARVV